VIFNTADGQKVGELHVRSRIKKANIIRLVLQSCSLCEE
jgi:hypothetical protein